MSVSTVVKFNAYTKPMVIRCANLSDRGPRAHEFATKQMGPHPAEMPDNRSPPAPYLRITATGATGGTV